MKSLLAGIIAVLGFVPVFANECKDLQIPTVEFAVKAGSSNVFVPVTAVVEVVDMFKTVVTSDDQVIEDAITHFEKIPLEFDPVRKVVRVKASKIKLGQMPFANSCKVASRLYLSFNENDIYKKDVQQGTQFGFLESFGKVRMEFFEDGISTALTQPSYEIVLPNL